MGAPNEGQTMLDTDLGKILENISEDDFQAAMEMLDDS